MLLFHKVPNKLLPTSQRLVRCLSTADTSAISSASPKSQLDEFYTYYTTRKELRPYIYRPKNSSLLISKNLKDPKTGEQLKPKDPIKPLSSQALISYINSIPNGSNDLLNWFLEWTKPNHRKRPLWNYITPRHIQELLINSFFKIGNYSYILSTLYSTSNKFIHAGNPKIFDINHFFDSYLICNIHRNQLFNYKNGSNIQEKKLRTCWNHIVYKKNLKQSGLTNLLLKVLGAQQGFDPFTIVKELKNINTIELPIDTPIVTEKNTLELENFFEAYKFNYLACKTIEEFDPKLISESSGDIKTFITYFSKITEKLGKEDYYTELKNSITRSLEVKKISDEKKSTEAIEVKPETTEEKQDK
ncbi:hypothetical protein TBLA_0C02420 [Henningerozyma blattae CBS 6284]|uniref:37S ribosomal protein MRP13, mitochondrial n=1 Tax=Henningerozyma blattae (strain ATCC 34711 / CBS 6284 / DSM 70876 / NBRC 10599 / NRRL Y-10934 / UCD 77-7) TaxID=1071380 RepID=I2H100_HENB6|nr:hypothetical protein TBLA_0C02420 [Tetrapisispora blattae CBS 6284]CCH60052.1 hypothetical protein TBLA_0C02420 [Tetrapisispora blattae CBS 6284]